MSSPKEYTQEELYDLDIKSKQFHDALYSEPIDEAVIVDILSNTTNEERQIIRNSYKSSYKVPIQNDIKSQLDKELKELAIDLFDTPYEYDARELHRALNSLTVDDDLIIEIFASRPKAHFEYVESAYEKFYEKSLRDDIEKHTPKEFAEFLFAIMETERPIDQTISGNEAYENASEMAKIGLKEFGIDVNIFQKIFIERSREDLILIARAYYESTQENLYEAIEKYVEGKNKKLLMALVFAVITPPQFFSEKCANELQKHGRNSATFFRVMVSRADIDMYAIRDYYIMDTNRELKSDIDMENSPAYVKVLSNLSLK